MGLLILAALLIGVFFLLRLITSVGDNNSSKSNNNTNRRSATYQSSSTSTGRDTESMQSQPREITERDNRTWNEKHKKFKHQGINRYEIASIYYSDATKSDLGFFDGFIRRDKDNTHSKYAIAVYTNNNVRVGYIPRYDNKKLVQIFGDEFEDIPVFGYIEDGQYYTRGKDLFGEVYVVIDATEDQVDKCKEKLKSLV